MNPCAHCQLWSTMSPTLIFGPNFSTPIHAISTALPGKLDMYGTAGASGIHVSKEIGPAE